MHTYTHSRQGTTFCATIQRVENLLQPPQVWLKPTHSIVVIWVKIFKTEKTIEIHVVRLTDVRGKVRSEKYAYKSVKRALLLSNVIDADHQKSCLFTNKGHFSLPLWVLIGVLAKFHE